MTAETREFGQVHSPDPGRRDVCPSVRPTEASPSVRLGRRVNTYRYRSRETGQDSLVSQQSFQLALHVPPEPARRVIHDEVTRDLSFGRVQTKRRRRLQRRKAEGDVAKAKLTQQTHE